MIKTAVASVILFSLFALGNGHFKWVHRFQEWRYERKVDGTQEWQEFQQAFEVRK